MSGLVLPQLKIHLPDNELLVLKNGHWKQNIMSTVLIPTYNYYCAFI